MEKKKEKRKIIMWSKPHQLLMDFYYGEKERKKKDNHVEQATPTPYGLLQ
jgi:hypothetical protein